eukprot:460542-Prymnesium_polylepis.1
MAARTRGEFGLNPLLVLRPGLTSEDARGGTTDTARMMLLRRPRPVRRVSLASRPTVVRCKVACSVSLHTARAALKTEEAKIFAGPHVCLY